MASYERLEGETERGCLDAFLPEDANVSGYTSTTTIAKKLLSEFIGSFILVFAAAGGSIMNQKSDGQLGINGSAAASGVAVTIIILATGHISGAHINPAVTLAFATFRHFSWFLTPLYIVVQLVASVAGAFVLKGIYHPDFSGGVTVPSGSYWQSFLFEIILTAILMFVITSVATDTRAVGELAGIAVGATVYLDILLSGLISGASMNPVRSVGPAIAANNYSGFWIYILGPIIGAQIGAGAYTLIRFKDQESQRRRTFKNEN